MYDRVKNARRRIVGVRQVLRAIEQGEPIAVVIAQDAAADITAPVAERARTRGIPVYTVDSMQRLGRAAGIDVAASVVAVPVVDVERSEG
ncbi:MAG: ribosomal L7Ae/L30e/S12e/Gadd45 family protein [Hydrogenibacillus sp.]|nr:ribosomal L7Ae/L30e/S12e/Gadd45 family protein [Hydrogenibacillus sp.]